MTWKDITINKFIEIAALDIESMTPVNYQLSLLSILKDIPIEEIEASKLSTFEKLTKELNFINTTISEKPKSMIQTQGGDLYLIDLMRMSIGEFIDLEFLFTEDYNKNIKTILSILYRELAEEETILHPHVIEPYGYYIKHRSKLFGEIPIDDVYGSLKAYIEFRTLIFKNYGILFEGDNKDLDADESIEGSIDDMPNSEKAKLDAQKVAIKKWSWDLLLYKLANNDVLQIEAATRLPLIQALNSLAMQKELGLTK